MVGCGLSAQSPKALSVVHENTNPLAPLTTRSRTKHRTVQGFLEVSLWCRHPRSKPRVRGLTETLSSKPQVTLSQPGKTDATLRLTLRNSSREDLNSPYVTKARWGFGDMICAGNPEEGTRTRPTYGPHAEKVTVAQSR